MRLLCAMITVCCLATACWLMGGAAQQEAKKPSNPPALLEDYKDLILLLKAEPHVRTWMDHLKFKETVAQLRPVKVNHRLLQKESDAGGAPFEVQLQLFEKAPSICVLERGIAQKDSEEERSFVWTGHIKGKPGSSATITCFGSSVFADIRTLDDVFQIRPGPDWKKREEAPLHAVLQLRESAFPPDRALHPEKKKNR